LSEGEKCFPEAFYPFFEEERSQGGPARRQGDIGEGIVGHEKKKKNLVGDDILQRSHFKATSRGSGGKKVAGTPCAY